MCTTGFCSIIRYIFTICVLIYGFFHITLEMIQTFVPIGMLFVGLFSIGMFVIRIPPPDIETVETIIGKPLTEEAEIPDAYYMKTAAHRGAGLDAPENSLAAFDMCCKKGCNIIEFDVSFTSDNVPIVFHDDTLERMADMDYVVSKTKWDELSKIDISVKHPFKERFVNTRIPTLYETVELLLKNGQYMFIDVKDSSGKAISSILNLYEKYPDLYSRAVVSSFYPNLVYYVRRSNPRIVCSLAWRPHCFANVSYNGITGAGDRRTQNILKYWLLCVCDILHEWLLPRLTYYILGISLILLHKDAVSPRIVEQWRKKGVRVVAWTVNHPVEKQYFSRVVKDTIKLSIYYETLCSDSIRFIKNQLNSTYEKIGSSIHVDFIPYGFAKQYKIDGKWRFFCQHGTRECDGNKYHACELAQGNGEENDVKFIDCSMKSRDPTSSSQLKICAERVGIDFAVIEECFRNGQGDELLAKYGENTDAVFPKIRYIPAIIINDVYSTKVQNDAEFQLLATICSHLPKKPSQC